MAAVFWVIFAATTLSGAGPASANWCVARSDASDVALQTALDYACGAGADCTAIQSSGLCYLPNTVQAHASFAFNSYYQRKGGAPGSCSFAATSTIARTDPSYGSCVYPSSPRTAGGMGATGGTPVGTTLPPPPQPAATSTTPLYGSGGGLTPDMGTGVPDRPNGSLPKAVLSPLTLFLIFWLVFKPSWS